MLSSIFGILLSVTYLVYLVANFFGSDLFWVGFCITVIAVVISGISLGIAFSTRNFKQTAEG